MFTAIQELPASATSWVNDENTTGAEVAAGARYWYRVVAFESAMGESAPSNTVDALAAPFIEEPDVGRWQVHYGMLAFGDYDGDADLDLALIGERLASAKAYCGDGAGGFSDETPSGRLR